MHYPQGFPDAPETFGGEPRGTGQRHSMGTSGREAAGSVQNPPGVEIKFCTELNLPVKPRHNPKPSSRATTEDPPSKPRTGPFPDETNPGNPDSFTGKGILNPSLRISRDFLGPCIQAPPGPSPLGPCGPQTRTPPRTHRQTPKGRPGGTLQPPSPRASIRVDEPESGEGIKTKSARKIGINIIFRAKPRPGMPANTVRVAPARKGG